MRLSRAVRTERWAGARRLLRVSGSRAAARGPGPRRAGEGRGRRPRRPARGDAVVQLLAAGGCGARPVGRPLAPGHARPGSSARGAAGKRGPMSREEGRRIGGRPGQGWRLAGASAAAGLLSNKRA